MTAFLKNLITQKGFLIKRSLLASSIFFMLIAIQTYINYQNILINTASVQEQAQKVLDEISYFNHFQLKFLNVDYAQKFIAHENNILSDGEALITFQIENPSLELTGSQTPDPKKTPREERKSFFTKQLAS
jgi:hypothetical protein